MPRRQQPEPYVGEFTEGDLIRVEFADGSIMYGVFARYSGSHRYIEWWCQGDPNTLTVLAHRVTPA